MSDKKGPAANETPNSPKKTTTPYGRRGTQATPTCQALATNIVRFAPKPHPEAVSLPWQLGVEWLPLDSGNQIGVVLVAGDKQPCVEITSYALTGPLHFKAAPPLVLSLDNLRALGEFLLECHEEASGIQGKVTA